MNVRKFYLLERNNEGLYSGTDFNTVIALIREHESAYDLYTISHNPHNIVCFVQKNIRTTSLHSSTLFAPGNERKLVLRGSLESTLEEFELRGTLTSKEIMQLFREEPPKIRKHA
jgi:predicted GIY-YIG superfamily endonuclease